MKISSLPHGCVGIDESRPIGVLDWFDIAAVWGLNGVEIMDQWVTGDSISAERETWNRPFMSDVQRKLSDLPLEVSAFINHGPYVWPSAQQNEKDLDRVRFFMDWAAELGKIFRVTTGVGTKVFKGLPGYAAPKTHIPDLETTRVFSEMVDILLPYAKARGLVIALEEHLGFAGTVAKMEKILGLIADPGFGIAFDMKNTLREGEDPAVILEKKNFMDRILYTHVDNFRNTASGWDRSVSIDRGEVDIRRLVLGLKANGYDGWLSVEYGGKQMNHVLHSARWLRSVWNEGAPGTASASNNCKIPI